MQLSSFGVNDARIQQKQLPWQQKQTCNSTNPVRPVPRNVLFLEALTPRFAKADFVTWDKANNGQQGIYEPKVINSSILLPGDMDMFCQTPLSWKVLATIACLRFDILPKQEPQMTCRNCQKSMQISAAGFHFQDFQVSSLLK